MELERYLKEESKGKNVLYIPSDLIARDERTRVCDLNQVSLNQQIKPLIIHH